MRKTKQTVEIYTKAALKSNDSLIGVAEVVTGILATSVYNETFDELDVATEKGV
jgi:hypothetical protein